MIAQFIAIEISCIKPAKIKVNYDMADFKEREPIFPVDTQIFSTVFWDQQLNI